jgi:hypothetical protein
MKNSPEDEWMKDLENRLRKYAEQPDESVWANIHSAVKGEGGNAAWRRYALAGFVLFLVFLPFATYNPTKKLPETNKYKTSKSFTFTEPLNDKKTEPLHQLVVERRGNEEFIHKSISKEELPQQEFQQSFLDGKDSTSRFEPLEINQTERDAVVEIVKDSVYTPKTEIKAVKEKQSRKRIRPLFYVMAAPYLSYWHVQPKANDKVAIQSFNPVSILSPKRLGFSVEGGVQWPLTKKLEYVGGVSLYWQKQSVSYCVNGASSVESVQGGNLGAYNIAFQKEDREFVYDMMNVGIASGLLYQIKERQLSHKIGFSLSGQRGFKESGDEIAHRNASSTYFDYATMYRVEYSLKGGPKLFVQPTYSRTLYTTPRLTEPLTIKPARVGISIGVVF